MTGTRRDVLRLGVAAAALFAAGPRARAATAGFHFPQAQRSGSRWRGRAGAGRWPGGAGGPGAARAGRARGRASVDRRGGHSPVGQGGRAACPSTTPRARANCLHGAAQEYAAQRITLKNPRQVNPSDEDMKRIEREMAEQSAANRSYRAGVTPSNLILDRPVPGGRLSSPFGLRRIFNGEERNPHSGLDFAVPAGTPIKAPAAGVVTLVGDYFFNGKTVFLDHGQGMVSMFCHMSAIDVKVGTRCRAAGGGQGGRHGPRHGAAPALERQPERCAGRSRDLHRRLQALIVAAQARRPGAQPASADSVGSGWAEGAAARSGAARTGACVRRRASVRGAAAVRLPVRPGSCRT